VTKKQARGGDARWKIRHLPSGTDKKFTDSVVPLAKLKAATLAPWAGLNHKQVQEIMDIVFDQGKFVVTDGDAWCGLVSFLISYKLLSHAYHHVDLSSPEQLAQWIHNHGCRCFQPIQERAC